MKRSAAVLLVFSAAMMLAAQNAPVAPQSSPTAQQPSASPAAPTVTSAPPSTPVAPAASASAPAASRISKDETVYALLDPTGAVRSVIVSDWLHSDRPGAEIKDRSNLTGIENVKGYETPKKTGDSLIWKLDGSDLYYRGKSSRSLPLSVSIKYWLDGKPVEPSKLAGKAGTVRVRIEVKNLAAADRVFDGVKRRIYAPMIVVVGMDLPVLSFTNVKITDGRLLTDGQNNIAAGVLLPGLRESILAAGGFGSEGMDLSSIGLKDLPIPDAFEFTAKVDKFQLGSIFIVATPDFPEIGGSNTVGALDDALAQFQKLTDASKAIKDGSAAIAAGASALSAGISQAVDSVKPIVAENEATLSQVGDFIMSDENITAARQLLDAGDKLVTVAPTLLSLLDEGLDSNNRQAIARALESARKINVKDLVGAPLIGSLISDSSIQGMAEVMAASDELYHGLDERRLQAAATFAAGAKPLFDSLVNFDDTARTYNPGDGAALQAFGSKAAEYDAAAAKMAALGDFDAAKTAAGLADRVKSDTSYVAATAFLDDPAYSGLADKVASGASLTQAERDALTRLLQASKAQRSAAQQTAVGQAAAALPTLAETAKLGAAARPAAAAAAAISVKTLPGLAVARDSRLKTEQIIEAGRRVLDPKTVNSITSTVPRIFAVKKSYDKNRALFQAARTFLAIRLKNGGFRNQLALIDSTQRELKTLEPFLTRLEDSLQSPEFAPLLGDLKAGDSTTLQNLVVDVTRLQPLLAVGKDALSQENVAQYRSLLAQLPELGSGIDQLAAGASLLAEKTGELADGTRQFDEQGIEMISDMVMSKVKLLRGFLKVRDALTALSRDYRSFSGAPDNADMSLKFIFKTDEIK
jgi:putative membrane protein